MALPASYLTAGNRGTAVRDRPKVLSALYHQSWNPAAVAAVANGFKTTVAGPNTTTITYYRTGYTGGGNVVFDGSLASGVLDYSRNVVITVTHATSVVAVNGVISGVDIYGKNLTEAWSVTATGTSKTFTGKKAFARVDTITVVAASDASTDSVVMGTGNVLGLDLKACRSGDPSVAAIGKAILEISNNTIVTTGSIAAASTNAAEDPRGTYTPGSGNPDGSRIYDIWYISDDPEGSAP